MKPRVCAGWLLSTRVTSFLAEAMTAVPHDGSGEMASVMRHVEVDARRSAQRSARGLGGFLPGMSATRLNNAWIAFGLRANFMYEPVL